MVEIILVNPENQSLLQNCAEDVFDYVVSPEYIATLVSKRQQILVVALANEIVVGQCLAAVHHQPDKPPELYIDNLGVSEPYHRRGVATRLVEKVIKEGKLSGCAVIWVATEPDNIAATSFYKSMGLVSSTSLVFSCDLFGKQPV
jgi:aminoglycoside 6'-N-acetyltransferase I